jgi:hypothetical protein
MGRSGGHLVDGKRILKIVAEPSCALHAGGCTTSLPAKTGTTRRELREDPGATPGAWREIREPRNGSVARRQLRASGRTLRTFGGNPGEHRGVGDEGGWRDGQPDFRRVSWTGGRTYGVWFADCPSGPARRGNRRGVSAPAVARPLHLIHAGAFVISSRARLWRSCSRANAARNGAASAGDSRSRRRRRGYPRAHVAWSLPGTFQQHLPTARWPTGVRGRRAIRVLSPSMGYPLSAATTRTAAAASSISAP